ncbi:heat shock protein HspQ [Phycisphaeraceae bacterium D3-23]
MSQHQPINIPDYFPGELPAFRVGQIVRHKRYGYRGVVVDFDMACLADDNWYGKNKTKPDRDQPWYHVLVHGSNGNTYAAQESLVLDALDEPIEHPLMSVFFETVDHGQYERNDEHWPGWNG